MSGEPSEPGVPEVPEVLAVVENGIGNSRFIGTGTPSTSARLSPGGALKEFKVENGFGSSMHSSSDRRCFLFGRVFSGVSAIARFNGAGHSCSGSPVNVA